MRTASELANVVDKCKTRRQVSRMKKVIRALCSDGKIEPLDSMFAGWYAIGVETGMDIAEARNDT